MFHSSVSSMILFCVGWLVVIWCMGVNIWVRGAFTYEGEFLRYGVRVYELGIVICG